MVLWRDADREGEGELDLEALLDCEKMRLGVGGIYYGVGEVVLYQEGGGKLFFFFKFP